MKARMIVLSVSVLVCLSVALGVALLAAPVQLVKAAVGVTAPQLSTSAVTHTVRIPLVANCYPRLGPDPSFGLQYDMSLINADDAWGLCSVNASTVIVAIIDSGVDLDHPDLQANLLSGYDFWDYDTVPEDGNGHGTNVAGIAAAALNGVGVAGVAPTAKILPVRVLNNDGAGYLSDVADGIIYSADRAHVLNLSLGGTSNAATLQNAINYAANTKGRLVVAAAGNCGDSYYMYNGCSYMNQPVYPGSYSNVMAVAATTSADTRASFSNVGSYVDIAAPGDDIYNTYMGNSYDYVSGTSQAAPHVAGLAAQVWAKYSGYTAAQVWSRMTSTSVDLGAVGVDTSFGAGRIDVRQALGLTTLQAALPEVRLAPANMPVVDQRSAPIAPGRILVKFKDTASAAAVAQTLRALPGTTIKKSLAAIETLVLSVPVGSEWDTIEQLRTRSDVEYAEPDYVLKLIR
jgi:thermitase